jgi:hypothetical protein
MPLLPYCMMVAGTPDTLPEAGVHNAAVESLVELGVECVFSRMEKASGLGRGDALQFHAVINAIFQQVAVIPFRFPTVLEKEEELREFLYKNAGAYLGALARLREMVQMEIRIILKQSVEATASGTEYLRKRQASSRAQAEVVAAARGAVGGLAEDWRERSTAQGMRCYALVRRGEDASFRERLGPLRESGRASVTVSGPWPPAEFVEPQGGADGGA